MRKFEKYAQIFREIFNLSEDDSPSYWGETTWAYIEENPLGSIVIEWGNRVEGSMGLVAWYRGRPIVAIGQEKALTPLVYIAERCGLSVDHPYLECVKQRPEYKQMVSEGRVILKE